MKKKQRKKMKKLLKKIRKLGGYPQYPTLPHPWTPQQSKIYQIGDERVLREIAYQHEYPKTETFTFVTDNTRDFYIK